MAKETGPPPGAFSDAGSGPDSSSVMISATGPNFTLRDSAMLTSGEGHDISQLLLSLRRPEDDRFAPQAEPPNRMVFNSVIGGRSDDFSSASSQQQLELLAYHRNLLLEERIRSELQAQAILSAQVQSLATNLSLGARETAGGDATTGSGLFGGGTFATHRLNYLGTSRLGTTAMSQGVDESIVKRPSEKARVSHPLPPLKKKHRPGDAALAAILQNINSGGLTKYSFPVPSAQRRKTVTLRDMQHFQKTWQAIRDRTAGRFPDARLKEEFDKELFARRIIRFENRSLASRLKDVS